MSAQEPPVPPSVAADFLLLSQRSQRNSGNIARRRSASTSPSLMKIGGFRAGVGLENIARRTLGVSLLLVTVVLWTGSNFLASSIFADNSYSKPYFVTYLNTSFFAFSLIPILLKKLYQQGFHKVWKSTLDYLKEGFKRPRQSLDDEDDHMEQSTSSNTRLLDDDEVGTAPASMSINDGGNEPEEMLSFRETTILSLEFCLIWFIANFFVSSCLEYTTVASSTILTSTSSIWTLVFGAIFRVESFTFKKLIGVLASLSGIILISMVDLSGKNDDNRGSFPHKSQHQIAIGDAMAIFSAVMYGVYTVVMKKRVGNEDRVSMPLFFGLVGFFNVIFLWPGFFIMHFTGFEKFTLPPTGKIWTIVLLNAISSFVSDYCWAYAMLLTTPLVVTVGLSLTIPLSLVGQMILSSQYSSGLYWVGACVVLLSFLFINHESHEDQVQPGDIPSDTSNI